LAQAARMPNDRIARTGKTRVLKLDMSAILAQAVLIKKALILVASLTAAIVATAAVLYVRNAPPAVPTISAAESVGVDKPFVVKLHAQWCPVCMVTKDVWSEIAAAYAGRVRLVVFDFTNEATTTASRAEAHRLGLDSFFAEN